MNNYEIAVTAVRHRADLFVQTMESLLANVDRLPSRILVHEDVVSATLPGPRIEDWLRACGIEHVHQIDSPASGMGWGLHWCLEKAKTPVVLYTQEDYLTLRQIPVGRALDIMESHTLNHVRFPHRQTQPAKHEGKPERWEKVEVTIGGQVFCVSDHWYTQMSLWRVKPAREGVWTVVKSQTLSNSNQFVVAYNKWMTAKHGDERAWNDQQMRHEKLKTYIWGPVGEPAFVKHTGTDRTTGPFKHTTKAERDAEAARKK